MSPKPNVRTFKRKGQTVTEAQWLSSRHSVYARHAPHGNQVIIGDLGWANLAQARKDAERLMAAIEWMEVQSCA